MDVPPQDIPQEVKNSALDKINQHWEEIIQALIDRAKGLYMRDEIVDAKGMTEVRRYQKEPDREAAIYLLNQKIGKPGEGVREEEKVIFILDE
jgi:hypothetical protein